MNRKAGAPVDNYVYSMKSLIKYIVVILTLLIFWGIIKPCHAYDERNLVIPPMDQNPIRDVAMDKDGNLFIIALKWNIDRPQIKSFNKDGEQRMEFGLSLPSFCCEPFPLKIVYGKDQQLYILMPSKEGLRLGEGKIMLVRIDSDGLQDSTFGEKGIMEFPLGFRLRDFDVSSDGKIWVLNDQLELFTFDDSRKCIKVRQLKDILPEKPMGGWLEHYYGRNLFALDGKNLLLFGKLTVSSARNGKADYYSVLEMNSKGDLLNHYEWEIPWFHKRSSQGSFFEPLIGKSIISRDGTYGSALGNPEGIRGEPNRRELAVADWSMKDGFNFYNIQPLNLPKEIYLGYDLNLAFFIRNETNTLVFFPMDRTKDLLVQVYDSDGKQANRFNLDVYK